ncbi:mechanosensitive ion channel [Roseomonas sp. OT10]|uniref:mechanosensitive ion channel domain-containing protein n=1 Tax=Roseomonas cutis TaxID=2897332 RepID=UPI001E4DACD2|nr:mechanosensitive ion channel domain-containing protein [Roseomonas sp. OT10]UFN47794.1 mechanosensitive ion channel [Roseomonas sp. OT10]
MRTPLPGRLLVLVVLALAGLLPGGPPARAQVPVETAQPATPAQPAPAPSAPARAAPRASGTAAPPAASATPHEAERLAGILRDEARRAELIRSLEALAAAERAARPAAGAASAPAPAAAPAASGGAAPAAPAPAAEPAPAAAPEAPAAPAVLPPNTLGAQIITGASERLQALSQQIVGAARALTDLPAVASWASGVARDPVTRTRVFDASWKLALLFGLGLLAEFAVFTLLRRWRDRLDGMAPAPGARWGWLRRVPVVLGRLLLDLIPLCAFTVVAYGLIRAVNPLPTTELILATANNAYLTCRAIMIASRMLFSPASSHLRLVPMADETAAYITVWLRRIVAVMVLGYAIAEASLQFGVPWAVYDGIVRLVMLVVSLFLVIVILQNRTAVAEALRAPALKPGDVPGRGRRLSRALRDRLAEIWHVVAILWLLALWAVWALEVHDGFHRLLRGTGATLLILAVAKGVDYALRRVIERGFRIAPDMARRYPGLEARANRYTPVLKGIVTGLVVVTAALTMLEAWGVAAFDWFANGRLGSRLLASALSIGLTVLIAVTVWEAANTAIARQLAKVARDQQAARSARVRTLLPMMRTALMIVIVIFVVLNVLSEIGVNVAPLIAGASVVGVAIGFGSQTLVKDVVTGMFLLLEDAVAVGDTVTAAGMTGVVERLSIRSIRLRAVDGAVHIIPFSTVTSVTNMTRDFAFAMFEFSLYYGEDTDRVAAMLREIAKEMRGEARWSTAIRDDLDVMGVEKLAETGVVLRARLKTDPSQRWPVTREMNRRIRERLDAEGIRIPSPWRKEGEAELQETPQAA